MLARFARSVRIAVLSAVMLAGAAGTMLEARSASPPRRPAGDGARAAAVANFMFTSQPASAWRHAEPRKAPLFKAGEALQFYAEPVNLGWSPKGTGYRFEMRVDVEIRSVDGQVVWGQRDFRQLALERAMPDPNTFITGSIAVSGLLPGVYILAMRLRDPANARAVETELAFGVVVEPRRIEA